MKKENALNILEDIRKSLNDNEGKEKALKTIEMYRKNIEITTNEKIQKLIKKQNEYYKKEGNNRKKIMNLNKKIDKELQKIFNS